LIDFQSQENISSRMTESPILKILCIEDDPGDATIIQRTLSRAGYDTTVVNTGAEGLAIRSAEQFDVILIDNFLPDTTGLKVLEELLENNPHYPAVLITGRGDEQTAVSAMKLGAKDYIIKDIDTRFPEELPVVVDRVYKQYVMTCEKELAERAAKNIDKPRDPTCYFSPVSSTPIPR
jgi:DNA-binding NtrC family response regulator